MVQPIADAISGIRWFHSGGIFAALSETIPALIIEGMQAAKSSGAVVSFDLNFREKLWKLSVGEERARAVIRRIVSKVDVLVGNDDIEWGLGIRGLEVTGKLKLDPTPFVGMISTVVARHPHIKIIATTLSDVRSTNRHAWAAGPGSMVSSRVSGTRARCPRPCGWWRWLCVRIPLRYSQR